MSAGRRLRVDHVAIAVHEIDRALDFFLEHFPAKPGAPKQPGYDDQFRWANFAIGNFKIELIESAKPGSFVERFLERRGEGLHHWTFHVDDLDRRASELERAGVRIVDRFDPGDGSKTAFLHPKSSFGTLIQLWQVPELATEIAPSWGGPAERDGSPWQVDHLSIAVRSIDQAIAFFRDRFDATLEYEKHLGYDGTFALVQLRLRDYRLELMEPHLPASFLTRFLERRGEGMHHLSIDVGDLDRAIGPLERAGARIVDRFDLSPEWRTAFIHPRSAFGTLIQFWQTPEGAWEHPGTLVSDAP